MGLWSIWTVAIFKFFLNRRWRMAAIFSKKNCDVFKTVWPKFCMVTHTGLPDFDSCSKIQFQNSKMEAILKNCKREVSAAIWLIMMKSGMAGIKKSEIWKSSWKRKIAISPKSFSWFWQNFVRWWTLVFWTLTAIWKFKLLKIQYGRWLLFWKLLNRETQLFDRFQEIFENYYLLITLRQQNCKY